MSSKHKSTPCNFTRDLVRHGHVTLNVTYPISGSEFEEKSGSRSQSLAGHHQAGQCGSRFWSLLGQRTIRGKPYQHRRPCLFLSSSPPYIHSLNPRCRCHVGSGIGLCDNQNGSLQLHSGSTSSVVNRSTAAGPESSCQTHHWHRNTTARHSCAIESALAPS